MTLNITLQQGQQQKSKIDLLFEGKQTYKEPELNTDLYSEGYFLGYIGAEPTRPEDSSYWSGYRCSTSIRLAMRGESRIAIGHREYWANKLGVEIPSQF